ncbi:MAG TPA: NAD-dependent epimerase/dehydratase family protein, partial [Desulfuromonadaceae bacterium]|nr:NAD-dependent epimerase/dehydratase family protein [Desulfuromonadaceae bacterium]
MKYPKVLVTGALGWLGSRLVEIALRGLPEHPLLQAPFPGAQIRCLVLPGQDADALRKLSDRIEVITGDLRDADVCRRFCDGAGDAVLFHTAGIIHPRRVREFYEINRDGTARLLDAAIQARVKRAVVVSSNSPC